MWFHRVPVETADERLVDITDELGNVLTVSVRIETHRGDRAIVVCCDDPGRHFHFAPKRRDIAKDLWQVAINPARCVRREECDV